MYSKLVLPRAPRRLVLAAAVLAACAGTAYGQATTGSIFGTVSGAAAGDVVNVSSSTGISRDAVLDGKGRYDFPALPLGSYTVTVKHAGQPVQRRDGVTLRVNAGSQIDFALAGQTTTLAAIKVSASMPMIDVSSVDSRTVVDASQLAVLPLGRDAESIAKLSPGTVAGSPAFGNGNLVAFGGSSVSENAYYINGFNTTDPLKGLGGLGLPYGSIDQQEVLTGGYSAMYGRSDGGVINQVGKRGSNEWHFGMQAQWTPEFASADAGNVYYKAGDRQGQLYSNKKANKQWLTSYSVYGSGPLIKDKLYLFAAAEVDKRQGHTVGNASDSPVYKTDYKYTMPKWYAKLDWNITDNNVVELTGISSKESYQGSLLDYDYDTKSSEGFAAYDKSHKTGGDIYIGKYTGYLTDNLTLSAMYGVMKLVSYYATPGYDDTYAAVANAQYENPAITGGNPVYSPQSTDSVTDPREGNTTRNLRIDLEYHLGDHRIKLGIDNQQAQAQHQGSVTSGPGYSWYYGYQEDPTEAINPALGVGAPGGDGYFVEKLVKSSSVSVRSVQRAQYLEDVWQVNDRWLLSLGLRNDSFNNYNSDNKSYVKQTKQWAPRLGFSWDVNGDASLKVFGNAGRYYLAMPNYVALAAASATTSTQQYYTYTGIDANGVPTGLKALSGPVSVNGYYGQAPDPKTVASKNLGSEFQDEFILGATKQLNPEWTAGIKGTVRILRQAIDDVCDYNSIIAKAGKLGYDTSAIKSTYTGCYLFNPGKTNVFLLPTNSGGYYSVPMTNSDFGFTEGTKRRYYALEMFLEHPLGNGRWGGKIDYIFSRSYGNTEGQVRSDRSQASVSTTADWDYASIMSYANGTLSNDRKHQIKANGVFRISPEWTTAAVLSIASGAPKSCLGLYGPDESNPSGYGPVYHWCDGRPSPPGSAGRLPWTHQLDWNIEYRPTFAQHKLAFALSVFNVTNEQSPLLKEYEEKTSKSTLYYLYNTVLYQEAPRSMRFSISYDF